MRWLIRKTADRRSGDGLFGVPPALLPGAVIAGLGCGVAAMAGYVVGWFPITWLTAGTLIYTVDRWADAGPDAEGNQGRSVRYRGGRLRPSGLLALAVGGIVLPPIVAGEWIWAPILAAGVVVALHYSVSLPGLGRRWRERPIVKSLLPAAAVAVTVVALPALRAGAPLAETAAWILWVWSIVQINLWLCDLRDVDCDRTNGLESLPSLLGTSAACSILMILVGISWSSLSLLTTIPMDHAHGLGIAAVVNLFFSVVAVIGMRPRNPSFYHFAVDGGLLLPILFVLCGRFLVV